MSYGMFVQFIALCSIVATMNWKSSSSISNHPCTFNGLCTCSSPGPNLGLVQCINTPLASVPQLNTSKVFILHLEYNELRFLDDGKFRNTNMQRLQIRHNPITRLSENSFAGLQRSLRKLDLRHNQLQFFPRQAIQSLERLQDLDLTGNFILSVQKEDFRGLEQCLQTLILRGNALTNIPQDTFSKLYKLESLDLSENRLSFVSQTSFNSGLTQLQHFYLSDNAFTVIPYGALARLKSLRTVDLSRNSITTTNLIDDDTTASILLKMIGELKLQKLYLDDNNIQALHSKSFRHFAIIQTLSLNGNPLKIISNDAFLGTHIKELHLRACDLTELNLKAFNGLSSTLHLIDISHNLLNANAIGATLINMTSLVNVSFVGNPVSKFSLGLLTNSYQSLQHLHLESSALQSNLLGFTIDMFQIGNFRQLRTLGISQFLRPFKEMFTNFSQTIEEIVLKGSNLQSLDIDYFECLPRISNLDISSNSLTQIDSSVFKSIGRSLKTLNMANTFHYTVTTVPTNIFQHLDTLKQLDISNNRLKHLSSDIFVNMQSLEYLNLQDNSLSNLSNNTFLSNRHSKLKCVKLSFNYIYQLDSNTFSNLDNLRYLYLDENAIKIIHEGVFHNLEQLQYINIENNFIVSIERDAFQNLPRLEYLNLANNHLKKFPLEIFDQVGTLLTSMKVDVSRNRIQNLTANASETIVTIKSLDFSYNNITDVNQNYFYTIKNSLVKLYLSHNKLRNITLTTFGHLPQLQLLKLDNNQISTVNSDAFQQITSLRVVILCHNHLTNLPMQLFLQHYNLHQLDISNNEIQELSEGFFHGTYHLEYLKLARNNIFSLSDATFLPILSSLRHLDMSHNNIQHFSYNIQQMLTNLHTLDLAHNKFKETSIDDFSLMKRLLVLNLSNNPIENLLRSRELVVQQQLQYLDLSNTNIKNMQELNFSNLLQLNLSYNDISFLSTTCFTHIRMLRQLDLSHNKMNSIPVHLWPTVSTQLTYLNLAYNPIEDIQNESFLSLNVLDELNIEGISAKTIQSGMLFPLKYVRSLHVNYYVESILTDSTVSFDFVHSLSFMDNLRSIHLYFAEKWNNSGKDSLFAFRSRTQSTLPHSLTSIIISGQTFKGFDKDSLNYMQNRRLKLTILNTSLTSLSLVGSLGKVRQLKLDVSHNHLVSLEDPNTIQNFDGRGVFLHDLNLKHNRWKCDCDLNWIQTWLRRWRQKQCIDISNPSTYERSQELVRRLRETECFNKRNKSLIDVLKVDLECGWKSSAKFNQNSKLNVVIVFMFYTVVTFVYYERQ